MHQMKNGTHKSLRNYFKLNSKDSKRQYIHTIPNSKYSEKYVLSCSPSPQFLVIQFLSLKELSVTSFLGMCLCLFSSYLHPLHPYPPPLQHKWEHSNHTVLLPTFISVHCVLGLFPVSTYGSAPFFLMAA